jgi:hypothetical protein
MVSTHSLRYVWCQCHLVQLIPNPEFTGLKANNLLDPLIVILLLVVEEDVQTGFTFFHCDRCD